MGFWYGTKLGFRVDPSEKVLASQFLKVLGADENEKRMWFYNLDNENNESRKKVGQKLAFWENENPESVENKGLRVFGDHSHSMQSNAFSLILAFPVRSRGSDSTDYLYSPCSTASVYHLFISVIKRLSCCGSRGNFPGIVTDFVFRRVAETCLPA